MKPADGKIRFTEWLPDLPDLDNPGLTEVVNAVFVDGSFQPFEPLGNDIGTALASEPLGGIVAGDFVYVGLNTSLQRGTLDVGGWTDYSQATAYATVSGWRFVRFDDLVVATSGQGQPQAQTLGSLTDFSDLATTGTAPAASIIGRIGRFLFLGDEATTEYYVRWSANDDARNWPTPGSATAISLQAGEQYLNPEWGAVTAIVGGDQFGLVMQEHGLTRVTYIGGEEVFQFDEIEGSHGCYFPNSVVRAGAGWYYISEAGFCFTDGVQSRNIGLNRVNDEFWEFSPGGNDEASRNRVRGAIDPKESLIYWSLSTSSGHTTRLITYNYESDKFTSCLQNMNCLLTSRETLPTITARRMIGFSTAHAMREFDGTPGTATFTTGEFELNPGGRTFVQGVKPLIEGAVTVSASVLVAARNSLDASVTFQTASAINSRTGFAGLRSDARYHRARVSVAGNFSNITGLEFQSVPSGST